MEQIQMFGQKTEQEQIPESRFLGDLFAEFLENKGRLAEFDKWASRTMVSVNGEVLTKIVDGVRQILRLSDPETLKMKILPNQSVRFHPAVAGG